MMEIGSLGNFIKMKNFNILLICCIIVLNSSCGDASVSRSVIEERGKLILSLFINLFHSCKKVAFYRSIFLFDFKVSI